jgi:hypothetical protein
LRRSAAIQIGISSLTGGAVGCEHDAVVAARTLGAHVAVEHIVEHGPRVALERISPAASAAELKGPAVLRLERHEVPEPCFLALMGGAGIEDPAVGRTVTTAGDALM